MMLFIEQCVFASVMETTKAHLEQHLHTEKEEARYAVCHLDIPVCAVCVCSVCLNLLICVH